MRHFMKTSALPLLALAWACGGTLGPARGQTPPPAGAGYQGFGLRYHLGYGYGGDAIGTGPNGGYPFYGGPGYLHPGPQLRRFGPEQPFSYFGGPGAACPNVFGPVGPLAVRDEVARERDTPNVGFGAYTGALPYPETLFAPFASAPSPDDAAPGADPAETGPPRDGDPLVPAARASRSSRPRRPATSGSTRRRPSATRACVG